MNMERPDILLAVYNFLHHCQSLTASVEKFLHDARTFSLEQKVKPKM